MDPEHPSLPAAAVHSWRIWLLTGARREPIDRRRLRGSHLGLKRALLEDSTARGEAVYGWKEFSDAMLRHAIGDAVGTLPDEDEQVLKLAYFGGWSNRDIAAQFGMTEAAVASRLRRALDAISDRIQRAGATVRKAAFAIGAWFCGRWCEGWLHRAAEASAVAAVAIVVSSGVPAIPPAPATAPPAAPAHLAQPGQPVRSEVVAAAGRATGASPAMPALPGTDALPPAPQIVVTVPELSAPLRPVVPPPPVQLPLRA